MLAYQIAASPLLDLEATAAILVLQECLNFGMGVLHVGSYSITKIVVCWVQANWLKAQGIKKGDAVAIYMPMTCECRSSLACCGLTPETLACHVAASHVLAYNVPACKH